MDKIKEIFSKFLEKMKTFFSAENFSVHKKEVIIIFSSIALILFLVIIILLVTAKPGNKTEMKTTESSSQVPLKKIDPNSLWLLDEPLQLPPIQFSREQRKIWKQGEIEYWYKPPSQEAMTELHIQNKKLIKNLLEEAP